MYALTLWLVLMSPPDKPIFPPANPCSNPVKCERYAKPRPATMRAGKGPRK
jgi:hypothetical protein